MVNMRGREGERMVKVGGGWERPEGCAREPKQATGEINLTTPTQ